MLKQAAHFGWKSATVTRQWPHKKSTINAVLIPFSDANISPCEKKRRKAIFSSLSYVPFCKPDGSWSEIQCERLSKNCWYVDINGQEVPGTRCNKSEKTPAFGSWSFLFLISTIKLLHIKYSSVSFETCGSTQGRCHEICFSCFSVLSCFVFLLRGLHFTHFHFYC